MEKQIPKVAYKKNQKLPIEVMTFEDTFKRLAKIDNHNPFLVHKIQFYFILVLEEGSYSHYLDFKFYDLEKGSALFIAKNQIHHFTKSLQNCKGFCIAIDGSFLEKNYLLSKNTLLIRLYNYHLESPLIHEEEMETDFLSITKELYQEYNYSNHFLKHEMLHALLNVLLLKAERAKESKSELIANTQWLEIFSSFKNILQKDYIKTRNSRFYASQLFISYKLLNDIIKKLSGKTAKTFIDEFVTIEIKRYLLSTSLSIKEIGYKTGFEEPSNMVKFFKKHTNTTPLKFRREI